MIETKIDASEAFRLYQEMGPGRSLRKLAEQTGIRLSLLGEWSSAQKWKERLTENTEKPAEQNAHEQRTLAELEDELATLRLDLEKQRAHLEGLQREFAAKLSKQRTSVVSRVPFALSVAEATQAVTTAQDALTRHIGQATESVYADQLYEAEQAQKAAQSTLTAFDQQHADVSVAQLQADREKINATQAAIEQAIARSRTLEQTTERR